MEQNRAFIEAAALDRKREGLGWLRLRFMQPVFPCCYRGSASTCNVGGVEVGFNIVSLTRQCEQMRDGLFQRIDLGIITVVEYLLNLRRPLGAA